MFENGYKKSYDTYHTSCKRCEGGRNDSCLLKRFAVSNANWVREIMSQNNMIGSSEEGLLNYALKLEIQTVSNDVKNSDKSCLVKQTRPPRIISEGRVR